MNAQALPPLIGLTGFARSGKDNVSATLSLVHSYEGWSFADNLREALYELDPVVGFEKSLRHLVDTRGWDEIKSDRFHAPEVRRLMQAMGDAGRSVFGSDAWIRALDKDIRDTGGFGPDRPIVIDDVRIDAEAEWIRAHGGRVWHVTRRGVGPINDHLTEGGISDSLIDARIHNDFDVKHLTVLIEHALSSPTRAAQPTAA